MNWYLLFLPLVLYAIFVIIMVVAFVFTAKYRNCSIYRINNPTCFTDWKCSDGEDQSPYDRFREVQKNCGLSAIQNAISNASSDQAKCKVYHVINTCDKRTFKDGSTYGWNTAPKGEGANITQDIRDFLSQNKDECESK